MLSKLKTGKKLVGFKQSRKAIRDGLAICFMLRKTPILSYKIYRDNVLRKGYNADFCAYND